MFGACLAWSGTVKLLTWFESAMCIETRQFHDPNADTLSHIFKLYLFVPPLSSVQKRFRLCFEPLWTHPPVFWILVTFKALVNRIISQVLPTIWICYEDYSRSLHVVAEHNNLPRSKHPHQCFMESEQWQSLEGLSLSSWLVSVLAHHHASIGYISNSTVDRHRDVEFNSWELEQYQRRKPRHGELRKVWWRSERSCSRCKVFISNARHNTRQTDLMLA